MSEGAQALERRLDFADEFISGRMKNLAGESANELIRQLLVDEDWQVRCAQALAGGASRSDLELEIGRELRTFDFSMTPRTALAGHTTLRRLPRDAGKKDGQ